MKLERLVIIGAGAVGGGIGGLLVESGFPVVMIARGEHGASIRNHGLKIQMPTRSLTVAPTCYESLEQVEWREGDMAMVATKLQDAETVMDQLLVKAGAQLPVVCASNGIHGERWTAARFETALSMLLWLPATHLVSGEVRMHGHPFPGVLDNGPVDGLSAENHSLALEFSRQLSAWLIASAFEAEVRSDMLLWKRGKWLTNLGGAAQALVTDDWMSVLTAAQSEGERVFAQANIEHVSKQHLLDRVAHMEVAPINGQERQGGSTWQSFQNGKPMESRWLEGAMADLGDEVGCPAPINRVLAEAAMNRRKLTAAEVFASARS